MSKPKGEPKAVLSTKVDPVLAEQFQALCERDGVNKATMLATLVRLAVQNEVEPAPLVAPQVETLPISTHRDDFQRQHALPGNVDLNTIPVTGQYQQVDPHPLPGAYPRQSVSNEDHRRPADMAERDRDEALRSAELEYPKRPPVEDPPMTTARVEPKPHKHKRGKVVAERAVDGLLQQRQDCTVEGCDHLFMWRVA